MDTLSLSNHPLKIQEISRDRAFYDQFEYVICVKIPEVSALRHGTHHGIDLELDNRQNWRGRLGSRNFGGSWRSYQREITDLERKQCHDFLDFLESHTGYKTWYSQHWAYIYSNDLSMLRQIESLPYLIPTELRRAIVDQERDTILVKSSPYSHRSYFREWRATDKEVHAIRNLLAIQQDVRLSPSLREWVDQGKWNYIRQSFFIDHDGNGIELMLALVATRPIRKTVTIKHHK